MRAPRFLALGALLAFLAGTPASCSAPTNTSNAAADGPIGQAAAAITGSTIIANGEQWVAAELHYCQAAYGAVDDDSSCWSWEGSSHVCDRESNPAWNAYRSDCSGFVTFAWGLPPIGDGGYVTGDFAPFGTSFSSVIQATDLLPGDACNLTAGGHIVLFKEWTTVGSEAVFLEEPGCDATPAYAHQFTSAVSISGSSIYIDYEGESFTAIRFNNYQTALPDYAATYVSQSWPLASTTMKLTVNQVLPASITFKNTGGKSWDSNTKLATTQPRDRKSPFYGADWLAANRLASPPSGTTVAPGDSFEFKFSFYAPAAAGSYDEFYGIVEDGVAWFSDAAQGGPADDVIEAKIDVSEAEYHGAFVSQTFPSVQDAPIQMTVGQTMTGTITLKNVGTSPWKAGITKLAPTPRDAPSKLGDSGWLSKTRVSSPATDVAVGDSFSFPLELTATTSGDFTQTFSLVEEAVTWFGDAPLGGGPPDNLLAVHVVVTDPGGGEGGGPGGDGSGGDSAGAGSATGSSSGDDGATTSGGSTSPRTTSGGCAYGRGRGDSAPDACWLVAVGLALAVRRRRLA